MYQTREDIDLIDLFLILWNGKKTLIIFIIIASLCGWVYLLIKNYEKSYEPIHESILEYTVYPMPRTSPYEVFHITRDFEELVNSKNVFDDWSSQNPQSIIKFEDISNSKTYEDMVYKKNEDELLLIFKNSGNNFKIIVRTENNKLNLINNYINYVNDRVTSIYYLKFGELIDEINNKHFELFENFDQLTPNDFIFKTIEIEQYLKILDGGQKILDFSPPSKPIGVINGPSNVLIMSISLFIGLSLGSIFLFVLQAINKRKNKNNLYT